MIIIPLIHEDVFDIALCLPFVALNCGSLPTLRGSELRVNCLLLYRSPPLEPAWHLVQEGVQDARATSVLRCLPQVPTFRRQTRFRTAVWKRIYRLFELYRNDIGR